MRNPLLSPPEQLPCRHVASGRGAGGQPRCCKCDAQLVPALEVAILYQGVERLNLRKRREKQRSGLVLDGALAVQIGANFCRHCRAREVALYKLTLEIGVNVLRRVELNMKRLMNVTHPVPKELQGFEPGAVVRVTRSQNCSVLPNG